MALIVGVDTYVTIEEANQYVNNYYLTSDPLRIQWENMLEEDKEVYLRRGFLQINNLPFTGKPKNVKQTLPFPRHGVFTVADMQLVKYAQIEQSVAITDTVTNEETGQRIALRRAGVSQYRIGDLSETFDKGLPVNSNANFFGLSEKAYTYLRKWLQGGYKVCTSIKSHYGLKWLFPLY